MIPTPTEPIDVLAGNDFQFAFHDLVISTIVNFYVWVDALVSAGFRREAKENGHVFPG